MIRHISTEELSAYLDSELGFVEVNQLEAHCGTCVECGARLASLKRVVQGLGRIERAQPPAALRQQIRRQVQVEPTGGFKGTLQAAFDALRLLLFPIRPALRTSAAWGLAVVTGLFAVSHGVDRYLRAEPRPPRLEAPKTKVSTYMGEVPSSAFRETTSEVAGRKFVWTEAGWVQRGLEWKTPEARVDARSPEGRALLTKCLNLDLLLADGSPVVLRYNLETVEIRKPPTTSMGGPRRHGEPLSA